MPADDGGDEGGGGDEDGGDEGGGGDEDGGDDEDGDGCGVMLSFLPPLAPKLSSLPPLSEVQPEHNGQQTHTKADRVCDY